MYTSGRPKNQNNRWKSITSPPAFGSKKAVLKFLSHKSIVIQPPKTGRDNSNRKAVIKTDQTKRGVRWSVIPGHLMFAMVTIKFIAPKIEDAPANRSEKIAKSTDPPECAWIPDKGA